MKRDIIEIPSFMKEEKKRQESFSYQYKRQSNHIKKGKERYMKERTKEIKQTKIKSSKSKVKILSKILFFTFIVAAAFTGHAAARAKLQITATLNWMNRDMENDLDDVIIDKDKLFSEDKVINILLIGADKRASWKEAGRSDSVMIATLDTKNKRLKIASLMRDMYVNIPGYEETKFNAAYSYGGVKLLYKTIAENFSIKLDGYVAVDFKAFESVIDAIGGIEITLTDSEYSILMQRYKNKKGTVLQLKPGTNLMDGQQALAYTRIRQDAQGDFGRTQRQRHVLQTIFTEAKSMSFSEVMELAKKVLPYISTDLTDKEIFSYLTSILMVGTTQIDQLRIPVDGAFTQNRIRNMAVLVPDLEKNKTILHQFIFEYDGTKTIEEMIKEN